MGLPPRNGNSPSSQSKTEIWKNSGLGGEASGEEGDERDREATEVKPPLHRKLGEKTKKDESLLERLVQILEAKKDKNDEGSSVGSIRLKLPTLQTRKT